jgi:glycine/D-amino acid oxidase-like deaminating enzyme
MSGDWGYRRLTTHGGSASHQNSSRHRGKDHSIGWLSAVVTVHQRLGSTKTTAQAHPGKFTQAIMEAAQTRGAELRIGRVTGVARQANTGKVEGVLVDGEKIDGDAVVIAMGPWSILAAEWLPLPAVFGLKGHSLVFDTDARLSADALFVEYREATGAVQAPEVFPRTDGTTYVCAISSDSPLPIDPADVAPDPGAIERLLRMCHELSPALASAKVRARQACYRPITRDGLPLIGRVPDVEEGAYVATGHSVWGILNAPATGEAMAELIVDGAAHTLDLWPFNPDRIPALDPTRLRRNP